MVEFAVRPMTADSTMPAIGSPEWSMRVLDIIDRDCMEDFDELCLLMGVT